MQGIIAKAIAGIGWGLVVIDMSPWLFNLPDHEFLGVLAATVCATVTGVVVHRRDVGEQCFWLGYEKARRDFIRERSDRLASVTPLHPAPRGLVLFNRHAKDGSRPGAGAL